LPPAISPHRFQVEPHYARIALGIAVVILYGSFYPFAFYLHHDNRGPLGVLLESGFRPASADDVVANILLYIPFGFFAGYALERRALAAVAGAAAAGFALSLFVELIQFYDVGRVQDLVDICTNTSGAFLGGVAAAASRRRVPSPYLALILVYWLGSRWYPAHPPDPAIRLGPFLLVPSVTPLDLFFGFAAWLAIGSILEALCGAASSRVVLPVLLVISLLLRALAVDVEPAEIAGGVSAAMLWCGGLWRVRARASIVALLFVVLVALLAMAPFHFSATARAFGWVPFRSFLESETGSAIRSFFEKAFLYGGMMWLLVRAGFSAGASTAFGAALVFCLRLTQVYLPGRSAEITDTILVLMFAAMMKQASQATP
jgi:glycopeptide antibiotics resistance protein